MDRRAPNMKSGRCTHAFARRGLALSYELGYRVGQNPTRLPNAPSQRQAEIALSSRGLFKKRFHPRIQSQAAV
jgi:hypothetical protein